MNIWVFKEQRLGNNEGRGGGEGQAVEFGDLCLTLLSATVKNTMTKNKLGRKGLIHLTTYSPP